MKARDIKLRAREALHKNWGIAIIGGIIYAAFCGGGFTVDYGTEDPSLVLPNIEQVDWTVAAPILAALGLGLIVAAIVSLVLTSFISVGYAQFNLDLVDIEKPRIGTIFSKWRYVGTAIGANLLVFLRVFIGLCFFIVPGIIAMYKYSMVNYVIADTPSVTAREALALSRRIMRGHKWRLFCLQLSFIGWNLVVLITFGIAGLWVIPYEQAAYAAFYREI